MKLSIIVPVYNVEHYIEKCILSLEDQDIPGDEYEIIVINDGSPDNSADVVKRLQTRYGNIALIEQENQGVSMARNNAIASAKGTYIMPIDPDDYVLPNTFKQMLGKAVERDLDVLYLGFDILNENGKLIWQSDYRSQEEKLFSGVEAYFASRGEKVMDPDRSVAILYKRSLLLEFGINYPKDVPYLEDGLFLAKVFCIAQRCGFNAAHFYQRTTRRGSATNSKLIYSERALNGFIKAAVDIQTFRKTHHLLNEQSGLVNHAIAKFILLPVTACAAARDRASFKKVKQEIEKTGFKQLDMSGCRNIYHKYASQFNKSINWFFIYYSYQLMLKSFTSRVARKNL